MLPDSPQNIVVVRAPSPSVHYIPGSINGDNIIIQSQNHQQIIQTPAHSLTQPVSESWCLTSVKVIKVCLNIVEDNQINHFDFFHTYSFHLIGQ